MIFAVKKLFALFFRFQFGAIYRVNVEMREYMNMICPQYDADATTTLRFPIYQVTQQLFENCELSEGRQPFNDSYTRTCIVPIHSQKLTHRNVQFQ